MRRHISELVEELLKKYGSYVIIAEKMGTGINPNTIMYWKSGRNSPSYANLLRFCEVFGYNISEINIETTKKQQQGIANKFNIKNGEALLPVTGLSVAVEKRFYDKHGYPVIKGFNTMTVPREWVKSDKDYCLIVDNDAMEPIFTKGSRLIVSPVQPVIMGDYVIFKMRDDNEIHFRRIHIKGEVAVLRSFNTSVEDIITSKTNLLFVHKVTGTIWP